MLEFRILGPLEVVGPEGPLKLGGPKQRAVLAILILGANRVVPVDRLADDLYGDEPPTSALTQIQAQISQLRKLLDPDRTAGARDSLLETRAPGYVLRLAPEQLDLRLFERAAAEAADAATRGDLEAALERYREALGVWRGPALADFGRELFAQPAIARLEDLRLDALENRIDCELALGRHSDVTPELEGLVLEHPLRERLRRQLMLALYRSGRQAEALAAYRRFREIDVEELGIEPTPALHELERAILTHDPSLVLEGGVTAAQARSVLVVASADARLGGLVDVAVALAGRSGAELILARPVADESGLAGAAAATNARRRQLTVPARVAAFTTSEWDRDVIRLTTSHDVELVLLDAPDDLQGDRLPGELVEVLERSPAHVAILAGPDVDPSSGTGVYVPFGGGEDDWAALELAAALAASWRRPVKLVGTRARPHQGRDASRLLADAALAVQRLVDVDTEPLLADPTEQALVESVAGATTVVAGLSPRWRSRGIGPTRSALVRAGSPLLLAHRGLRPGGLAPGGARTTFTWSLQA